MKNSQWTDIYGPYKEKSVDRCLNGPYSQINYFRNSNVFSFVLKFCTLAANLDADGKLIPY